MEEKLQPLGRHFVGMGAMGRGAGNGDILAACDGNGVLPTDDDSGALRADGDSDLLIGVGGAVGTIYSSNSVAIGDNGSVVIYGGGNLDANALRVGGCAGHYRQIACGDTVSVALGDALGARNTNTWAGRGSTSVEGTLGAGYFSVVGGVGLGTGGLSGTDIRNVDDVFSCDDDDNNNVPDGGGASVVGVLGAGILGSGGMGTCGYESTSTSAKIACAPQPTNWFGSELAQPTQLSLVRSASIGSLQSVCLGPPLSAQLGRPTLKR
jgi:hypothetical protein